MGPASASAHCRTRRATHGSSSSSAPLASAGAAFGAGLKRLLLEPLWACSKVSSIATSISPHHASSSWRVESRAFDADSSQWKARQAVHVGSVPGVVATSPSRSPPRRRSSSRPDTGSSAAGRVSSMKGERLQQYADEDDPAFVVQAPRPTAIATKFAPSRPRKSLPAVSVAAAAALANGSGGPLASGSCKPRAAAFSPESTDAGSSCSPSTLTPLSAGTAVSGSRPSSEASEALLYPTVSYFSDSGSRCGRSRCVPRPLNLGPPEQ
mmetsp:Transcript_102652/g.328961  ORF Transcript_102652/g.328961 Transcript_102652/m.328961 type:complete len:267 (-) Transcript_102652:457-1257(-)